MPIRILHVVRGSAFYGGPEMTVLNAFKAFDDRDFALSLAVLAKDARERVPVCTEADRLGLPLHFIPARPRFRLRYARRLRELIGTLKIDIMHTHGYKSGLFGLAAAGGCGIPAVATAHGWTRNALRAHLYEGVEARILKRFDRVCTCSEHMKMDLVRSGVAAERIRLVRNAVDAKGFAAGGSADRQWPSDLQVPEGAVLVGTIGRLSREKGQRFLLEAFAKVHREVPEAFLLIAGAGDREGELRALAQELGIAVAVGWVPKCPHDRVPSLLGAMDLFVLPSLMENQPLVLLEAMAAGVPVVATRVGGVGEIIEDSREGLLVRPGDSHALAETILRALGDGKGSRRAEKAEEKVRSAFSIEQYGRALADVYVEVVGRR